MDVSADSKLFMGLTVVMQLVIALVLGAAGVEVPLRLQGSGMGFHDGYVHHIKLDQFLNRFR